MLAKLDWKINKIWDVGNWQSWAIDHKISKHLLLSKQDIFYVGNYMYMMFFNLIMTS